MTNDYEPSKTIQRRVAGGDTETLYLDLRASHGWYDVRVTVDTDSAFERRFAGRVETGRDGVSDPALSA